MGLEMLSQPGKIIVIMPAANEEKTIGGVISGIKENLPSADIVVIVDKVQDRTPLIASQSGANVIRLPIKMGMGCAVQTGLKYAYRKGYEFAVRMDSDGQHSPGDIPALLLPVLKGEADLTLGSRYLKGGNYQAHIIRRGTMTVMANIVSWIYGKRFTDTTSGFKAMNRRVIGFLSGNYPVIGGTPTLILLKWAGFRVMEVPVEMKQRESGASYFTSFTKVAYIFMVFVELLALLVKKKNVEEVRK
jgi:glycosyltransferase involved in cell wall biosynthesis